MRNPVPLALLKFGHGVRLGSSRVNFAARIRRG